MGGDRYAVADKNLDQLGLYMLLVELLKLPFLGDQQRQSFTAFRLIVNDHD